MSPTSRAAEITLCPWAHGHPGPSSGAHAVWEILRSLQTETPVNFAGGYVRLEGEGKRAVAQLLVDRATGCTGLSECG